MWFFLWCIHGAWREATWKAWRDVILYMLVSFNLAPSIDLKICILTRPHQPSVIWHDGSCFFRCGAWEWYGNEPDQVRLCTSVWCDMGGATNIVKTVWRARYRAMSTCELTFQTKYHEQDMCNRSGTQTAHFRTQQCTVLPWFWSLASVIQKSAFQPAPNFRNQKTRHYSEIVCLSCCVMHAAHVRGNLLGMCAQIFRS